MHQHSTETEPNTLETFETTYKAQWIEETGNGRVGEQERAKGWEHIKWIIGGCHEFHQFFISRLNGNSKQAPTAATPAAVMNVECIDVKSQSCRCRVAFTAPIALASVPSQRYTMCLAWCGEARSNRYHFNMYKRLSPFSQTRQKKNHAHYTHVRFSTQRTRHPRRSLRRLIFHFGFSSRRHDWAFKWIPAANYVITFTAHSKWDCHCAPCLIRKHYAASAGMRATHLVVPTKRTVRLHAYRHDYIS